MNAYELRKELRRCPAAREAIPLELQMSLPLLGRKGKNSAECWYFRIQVDRNGLQLYSPALYVLWNIENMTMTKLEKLDARPLGSGEDMLQKGFRTLEEAYLEVSGNAKTEAWIAAAPKALQQWYRTALAAEAQ